MYDWCDWICGCEVKNAFFCYPCLLFSNNDDTAIWAKTGVADIKHLKDKIKKHASSATHISCSISYATLGRVDIKQELDCAYRNSVFDFNESVSKNRYILNKIIDCVKFCGNFEVALRDHNESEVSDNPGIFRGLLDFVAKLDAIFKEYIEKSTVFKGTSNTIQNDILDCMLAVIHDHIKKEVDEAKFVAIQVDETTDSSNKTQMIFIVRYVLNGIVHERFWKFVNPPGKTAEHLTEAIMEELQVLKINEKPEKLIAQSYGGLTVTGRKLEDVQTEIKQQYPNGNFIHCYAHQLNLILEKAASQHKPVKIFFANLHAFSSFFERSRKYTAVLHELVKLRLPEIALTQCDFNTKCVKTVYVYKEDLKRYLKQILDEEDDHNNINQVLCLQNYLKDEHFLYWLNFFYKILYHVDILCEQLLQMRDLDVIILQNYITSFNSNIQKERNTILEAQKPSTSKLIKRIRTAEDTVKHQIALKICNVILSEVKHRFGYTDHLMISQLFVAEKFAEYSKKFPQSTVDLVKSNYAFINPRINAAKLKSELEVIYSCEDFRNSAGAVDLLQVFINVNLSETFSEAVQLLNILCTLPMPTVESKRCFSTLKRVKTFLQNTMGETRLSALCMLSIEKNLIKSIPNFNERVIDYFAELEDRS